MKKYIVIGNKLLCKVGGKADGNVLMTEEEVIERVTMPGCGDPLGFEVYEAKQVSLVSGGWKIV